MFDSALLDVAIGLIFLYLTLSLITTAGVELIQNLVNKRAKDLEKGLKELLQDDTLVDDFYDHPLVRALYLGKRTPSTEAAAGKKADKTCQLPSYIPSRTFVLALLDVIQPAGQDGDTVKKSGAAEATPPPAKHQEVAARATATANAGMEFALTNSQAVSTLRKTVMEMKRGDLKQALLTLIDAADEDAERLRKNLEEWYDHAMTGVASWFKRWSQYVSLAIGLIVVVAINVDTIAVVTDLNQNEIVREALVEAADGIVQTSGGQTPPTTTQAVDALEAASKKAALPIGWSTLEAKAIGNVDCMLCGDSAAATPAAGSSVATSAPLCAWIGVILLAIPGWLISTLAISLGAPFWFDLLNKFIVVRGAIKPLPDDETTPPVPSGRTTPL
ncbi:MAG: hypothetical protein AAGD38_01145 [Acidobacteriota bacterium]